MMTLTEPTPDGVRTPVLGLMIAFQVLASVLMR